MALDDAAQAFLDLREQLPRLLREADVAAVRAETAAWFGRLESARTRRERDEAVDELITILIRYPALRDAVRRALRAGDPGGDRRGPAPPSRPRPDGGSYRGITGAGGYGGSWPFPSPLGEPTHNVAPAGGEAPPGRPGSGGPGAGRQPSTVLDRWPHIDLDRPAPLAAGSTVQVTVYVDTTPPHEGETSAPLTLPDTPEVHLQVLLVTSHHFAVDGDDSGWVVVGAGDARSSTVTFTLRVADGIAGVGVVTAFLAHDGRPAGSVHRHVAVGVAVPSQADDLPPPVLSVDLEARRPDLTVRVVPVPGSGGERFACTVSSPHLAEYEDGVTEQWDLPAGTTTKALVLGRMAGFTRAAASDFARRIALVGAGLDLFDAAPETFKAAYWELRDAGKLATIFVVSAEPYVPWELMVPRRDGVDDDLPIGVTAAVGRWVHAQALSPVQALELRDSYVIAPTYLEEGKRLSFSAAEARYVCDTFGGREISPAMLETIELTFRRGGTSLLHLVCHATDGSTGEQVIELDPDDLLTDGMLRGMPHLKAAFAAARPMVFINACEVGRQTPALVGTGGFAARFIALGARAVVAPIWSVKDKVAEKAAREFYGQVKANPERPYASILADIRRKAYEGDGPEDSWAAYCFYGDPLAASTR